MLSVKIRRHRKEPLGHSRDDIVGWIALLGFDEEHLHARDDEKSAEEEEDPVIAMDQLRAEPDHHAAHEQRAENSPEEHPMLIDRRHCEEPEDHRDDKNVVDRERFLDDVT